jgi:hypothetical protein
VASSTVLALGTAPSYGAAITEHDALTIITDSGVEGDRHAGKKRAVSIVCTGELARAASVVRGGIVRLGDSLTLA